MNWLHVFRNEQIINILYTRILEGVVSDIFNQPMHIVNNIATFLYQYTTRKEANFYVVRKDLWINNY